MKKQTHVEALEAEISTAQAELTACQSVLHQRQRSVELAVMAKKSDQEIDALQCERDQAARQLERHRLRLQGLEKQQPEAARKDTEALLPARLQSLHTQSGNLAEGYSVLLTTWEAFTQALARVEHLQRDSVGLQEQRDELTTLAIEHDLDAPELPPVPAFPLDLAPAVTMLRDKLARLADWRPVSSQATKQRLHDAKDAQAKRQAEAWVRLPPERRGPATVEILNALDQQTRDLLTGYKPPAPVHSQVWMKGA